MEKNLSLPVIGLQFEEVISCDRDLFSIFPNESALKKIVKSLIFWFRKQVSILRICLGLFSK